MNLFLSSKHFGTFEHGEIGQQQYEEVLAVDFQLECGKQLLKSSFSANSCTRAIKLIWEYMN